MGRYEGSQPLTRARLAQQASPPITLAANGQYIGYRRARIFVNDAASTGKTIAVKDQDGKVLAWAKAEGPGRLAINLPMPVDEKPYGALIVARGQETVGVDLGNPPVSRQQFLEDADFRIACVFSETIFPGGDFTDPAAVEEAIGPYTIRAQFYDADFNPVKRANKPGRYGMIVDIRGGNGQTDRRYMTLFRMPGQLTDWQFMEFTAKELVLPREFGISQDVTLAYQRVWNDYLKWNFVEEIRRSDSPAILLAGMAQSQGLKEPVVARTGAAARDKLWWHELKKRLEVAEDYKYVVHLPRGYAAHPDDKFPLLVYLHGASERGEDVSKLEENPLSKFLASHEDLPFILVTPLCPRRAWWDPPLLRSLLDKVAAKYRVDADRIYLTGISMGGYGTWETATWYPDLFAAIVPLCGIADAEDMARIKHVPTWVFHGDADPTVPFALDKAGAEALQGVGGNVKFTAYPGAGHLIGERTYENAEIYAWLLAQRRGGK